MDHREGVRVEFTGDLSLAYERADALYTARRREALENALERFGSAALPDGAEGDAPLELPGVLADEKGEVFLLCQNEVWSEGFLQPVHGAAGRPAVGRGEVGQPGARRGEEKVAAGVQQGR